MKKLLLTSTAIMLLSGLTYFGLSKKTPANKNYIDEINTSKTGLLLKVGDSPITSEDLILEVSNYTSILEEGTSLTPIPETPITDQAEIKQHALGQLVERKFIINYIKKHKLIDFDRPKKN